MQTIHFHNRALIIADEIMENTIGLASRAAKSHSPVLLVGESGTGKELFARYIHERSSRSQAPFVSINCAAIPEGLLEAELFGYERGAFTGAVSSHIGKFERASHGTLLLDEISEMALPLQAKLLRTLQEGEVDRLGGRSPISVQTRIIATTNKTPETLLRERKFREDLFYRLHVIRIDCCPLRGRRGGINTLVREFIRQSSASQGRETLTVSEEAMKRLLEHPWPGNVRELQNVMERAVFLADGNVVGVEHLEGLSDDLPHLDTDELAQVERRHILQVLAKSSGNRTQAASRLGISVRTLRNKLRLYGA